MKKIGALIVTASIVIAACMLYLAKRGISLTPAVLIKPSHVSNIEEIATAISIRLFPYFNEDRRGWVFHYQPTESGQDQIEVAKLIFQKNGEKFRKHTIFNKSQIRVDRELESMTFGHLYIQTYKRSEFELSQECAAMKRLNYRCWVEVSLHKSRRKMKEDGKKYFLVTSYLDTNFLLLIEE